MLKKIFRITSICLLSASILLAACSDNHSSNNKVVVKENTLKSINLIDHLSEGTLEYTRIPETSSLLFLDGYHQPVALADEMKIQQMALLKILASNPDLNKNQVGEILAKLLTDIDSPIEISSVKDDDAVEHVYIAVSLKNIKESEIKSFLDKVINVGQPTSEMATIVSDKNNKGQGQVALSEDDKTFIFYHFNHKKQQLTIDISTNDKSDWSFLKQKTNDILAKKISKNTTDKRGLLVWINIKGARDEFLAPLLSHHPELRDLVSIMDNGGYYAGINDGRYELGINILPQLEHLEQTIGALPKNNQTDNLQIDKLSSYGEPLWLTMFELPANDQLKYFLTVASKDKVNLDDVNDDLKRSLNLQINDLLTNYDSKVISYQDEAGFFSVMSKQRFDDLKKLINKLEIDGQKVSYTDTEVTKHIHDFTMHIPLGEFSDVNPVTEKILESYSHVYYTVEGNNVYLSGLLQSLKARQKNRHEIKIQNWALNNGLDINKASLGFATQVPYLAQNHYYALIKYVDHINRIFNTNINIAKLPTAQSLKMTRDGDVLSSSIVVSQQDGINFKMSSPNDLLDWPSLFNSAIINQGINKILFTFLVHEGYEFSGDKPFIIYAMYHSVFE